MRLWAVFLAIFLPAALVAEGCFLLVPAVVVVVVVVVVALPAALLDLELPAAAAVLVVDVVDTAVSSLGFI